MVEFFNLILKCSACQNAPCTLTACVKGNYESEPDGISFVLPQNCPYGYAISKWTLEEIFTPITPNKI